MSQPKDQLEKVFVPEEFEVDQVEPQDGEDLGENIDLRLLSEREGRGEGWQKIILMLLLWTGFFVLSLMALNYATANQNDAVVRFVLIANGIVLLGPVVHYFGSDSRNGKEKPNSGNRLPSYLGLLEKVARVYRKLTGVG